MIPQTSGLEVREQPRKKPDLRHVPVIEAALRRYLDDLPHHRRERLDALITAHRPVDS